MSLYSSDSQEGLLGPTPHRSHTGDKHAPLQPHLASWEWRMSVPACSSPTQLASFFPFSFSF